MTSEHRFQVKVGTRQVVLIDSDHVDVAIACSSADAPEIEGVVHVAAEGFEIEVGKFVEVDVVRTDVQDMFGEIVGV